MSGAPSGNRNAAKAKEWEGALRKAIAQHKTPDALRKIADGIVDKALEGDRFAIEEIANRLDGKPAQTINGDLSLYEPDSDAGIFRSRIHARVAAAIAAIGLDGDTTPADSGAGGTKV